MKWRKFRTYPMPKLTPPYPESEKYSVRPFDSFKIADEDENLIAHVYNHTNQAEELATMISALPDLLETLKEMHEAYGLLHNFLSEAIEGGRLTEPKIPDDYRAIVEQLAGPCNAADDKAKQLLKKLEGE